MKNLLVLLIHGTWGTAAEWKNDGSMFRTQMKADLEPHYRTVRFESEAWSGANRWGARSRVSDFLANKLGKRADEDGASWEYLIVAHSHGGNVATHAVREVMRRDPSFPILGVVCLNTPFLKHEVRASSSYVSVWLAIGVAFLAFANLLSWTTHGVSAAVRFPYLDRLPSDFVINGFLGTISVVLLLILLLHRKMAALQREADEDGWGPRPKVLCLSCADDEAITGLGLVEGIANLPQLLLHPLALALAAGTVILAIHSSSGLAWCQTATCWSSYVHVAVFTYGVFLLVAIVGGLLGSVVLALSFGLNWRLAVQSLVSRVLVSYSPLNPADAYFRGVSELPLGLLLHSQIYRSKSAMAEISNWLKLIR